MFFFVIIRIVANPVANVFQKQLTQRSAHPLFVIAIVHALLAIACLPYGLMSGAFQVESDVWINMAIAAVLAVSGNTLLVYALKAADLSILGPINAYKSVVSLILGIFLVDERPTAVGLAGVLLIIAGSYFVMGGTSNQPPSSSTHVGPTREPRRRTRNAFVRFFSERGIQLRFTALVLSATEALFLKRAILSSSPADVFVLWSVLGFVVALPATVVLLHGDMPRQIAAFRNAVATFLSLTIATGTMQLATLLTFRSLQVGYSLALFQLSTIVSVFLGQRYFAETNIRERLVGSLIMAAGAALIVVLGHRT